MRVRSSLLLVLVLSLIGSLASGADLPAGAVEPDASSSASTYSDQILVTASAIEEPLSSVPAAATVITREEIEERGASFVADMLREVPGLYISGSGSPGKAASLFTRGSNSTHTLVLLDGVEVNDPYFSGFNWGSFSTTGVERVEVVRGPFSALYGSDAMAGVVNIRTDSVWTGLRIDAATGENGLLDGRIDGAWAGGAWRVAGAVSHRDDDGFADNDDFSQEVADVSARWSNGPMRLALRARLDQYELGIPLNTNASGDALIASPNRRQDGHELQLTLPFAHELGAFSYEVTLSKNGREDNFEDPDDPFGFNFAETDSETSRAHVLTTTRTRHGALLVGGEFERAEVDDVTSYGVNLDDTLRDATSLFAEWRGGHELGRGRLELSAGVRTDDFDTFGRETSPRLAAALVAGRHKLRAAWGEGFRAPSIGELYFPFFGNEALDPERSTSWELGWDVEVGSGAATLTWFDSDFDNLIVFDNANSRFGNTGAATTSGIEAGLRAPIGRGFSGSVSYTWLDTEQTSTGEALLRRPEHSGSASLAWASSRVKAHLVVTHGGERDDVRPVFPFDRIADEAYTVGELGAEWNLGAFRPYVVIENAWDESYEETAGFRAPGRRALIGVRYSLQ
ncbi:MAG: TonB-dependent receptor plug domain-containing protein [Thermoanaerobaculia bacterium]